MVDVLKGSLDFYIPLAGTSLFVAIVIKQTRESRFLFISCFFYILFLVGVQFGIKEVLIPFLEKTPIITPAPVDASMKIILQEFETIDELPSKRGLVVQHNNGCFVFGTIAQQNPSSYLVQNAFIGNLSQSSQRYALYARHGKIIDRKIVLYKATIFLVSNDVFTPVKDLPKNYTIPIPFDVRAFFDLWGVTDPKNIKLIPIIINRLYTGTFALPILLALSYYLIGLVSLLIIATIAIAFKNTVSFKGVGILGDIAVLVCSYPLVLLLFYYLSLITEAIIHYNIKI